MVQLLVLLDRIGLFGRALLIGGACCGCCMYPLFELSSFCISQFCEDRDECRGLTSGGIEHCLTGGLGGGGAENAKKNF